MFDLDISKIALIGAVALIVIGPEKLPKVARTVGTLVVIASAINFLLISDGSAVLRYST